MNILNTQVSYYPGPITDKSSTLTVDLYDFITNPSPERIARVLKVRECTDQKKRAELKDRVNWITPSGIFSPPCTAEDLVTHSGFICLDFDAKHNPGVDFAEVKRQVSRLGWVAACTWSVSGTGLAMYVPIKYPERHHQHFDRLVDEFASVGLKTDRSCRNVNRARYDTYDPEPYINPNATRYAKVKEPTRVPTPRYHHFQQPGPVHTDIFRWACHVVETPAPSRTAYQFVEGQRHLYLYRLCCILNDYGVSKSEAETWINANLIPLTEITSNCIEGAYKKHIGRHGCKIFTTASTPSPSFPKPYTVMKRPDYTIDRAGEDKDWSEPTATEVQGAEVIEVVAEVVSNDHRDTGDTSNFYVAAEVLSSTPRPLPEIDTLLAYFTTTAPSGGPLKIQPHITVLDPVAFIQSHRATIETYKDTRLAQPFIDRLEDFRRYCRDTFVL